MRAEGRRPQSTATGWALAAAIVATIGIAIFLVLRLRATDVVLHLYVVTIAACGVVALADQALRGMRFDDGRTLPARLRTRRRRPGPERVRSLEELEHAVDFAGTTAFDVHYRLRPHLVRIAAHRLAARRGIVLEADPAAARAALGDELWSIVEPDREPPAERNAPGLPLAGVRRLVEALERV
ncbi:MAG: hypothetical protein ABI838_04740 [Chloroflexota bacterium]